MTDSGVIFDLDDTLYDERRFALSGYAAVASELAAHTGHSAHALFAVMWRAFRAGRRTSVLQELVADFDLPETMIAQGVEIIRTHAPRLRLPRRSLQTLELLRRRGHRLGILTNGLPATQRGKVMALAMAPLVDVVVYAQEYAPAGKPDPACFAAVLTALDVRPARAVFVGDHPEKDMAGARLAGMHTIWMAGRGWPAAPDADAVASRVDEVPALVERLLEARHVAVR